MPKKNKYWSLTKAIEKAEEQGIEVSVPTLIKWATQYGLGFQLGGKGGKWYIYPEKFLRYINGGKTTQQDTNSGTGDSEAGIATA